KTGDTGHQFRYRWPAAPSIVDRCGAARDDLHGDAGPSAPVGSPRGRPVTKRDLVRTIATEMGVAQDQVQEIVQRTLDGITRTLAGEGRIDPRDCGVFEVRNRRPRGARTPGTGEPVELPASLVVRFKQGREMQERVARLMDTPDGTER